MSKINGISIVMSCYNAEKWIEECIESILNQTFENFELIVINDGSTDKTIKILEKARNNDSRIKIFNQNNTGLTKSLNSCNRLVENYENILENNNLEGIKDSHQLLTIEKDLKENKQEIPIDKLFEYLKSIQKVKTNLN